MGTAEQGTGTDQGKNLLRKMTVFDTAQSSVVEVEGKREHLFSSNSYLDMCNEPAVKEYARRILDEYGIGSGGSRLTTGTTRIHMQLEETIAAFKKREAALVFNTGYMANVGILSALAGRGDIIYSDELNHASIIDGCRLSRADLVIYRHNDMDDLEEKIKAHPGRSGVIVSDGVFSMDGDIVNLPRMVELANRYGLFSMIDEAHATGVIGATGRGTEEYYDMEGAVDVLMGTLSKAVGGEGGFVCGSRTLIDYLVNRARSFIFSTSLSRCPWPRPPRHPADHGTAAAGTEITGKHPLLLRGALRPRHRRPLGDGHHPHHHRRREPRHAGHGAFEGAGVLHLSHPLPHRGEGNRPSAPGTHVVPYQGGAGGAGGCA